MNKLEYLDQVAREGFGMKCKNIRVGRCSSVVQPLKIAEVLDRRREREARGPWATSDQILCLVLKVVVALVLLGIVVHGVRA